MKRICVLLLLVICMTCNASPGHQSTKLSDLKSFNTIEKEMPFDPHNSKPCPEQLYLRSLRDAISKVPVSDRPGLLKKLTKQTEWGTAERFISCYVCAWYGIDYKKSRDYLTHTTFWWEWRIDPESEPFRFDDVGIDLLYVLYEHNHDFKILHDILTSQGDGGNAEAILGATDESIVKHPRGVLHVAELSKKGYKLAWKLLRSSPGNEEEFQFNELMEENLKTFRIYVTRVANDPSDPLSNLAKKLLKNHNRIHH